MVHQFLERVQRGEAQINPELFLKFQKDCADALQKQFQREPKEFTLRMSNLGRPTCQLEFEMLGITADSVSIDLIRNTYGDMVEKLLVFILYAAGVPIISEQEHVKLDIAGKTISGTLDLVISFDDDPRVWDIKSASDWTFKNKYSKSFEEVLKGDNFGYQDQLFLYAEARRCKVGGLLIVNKQDGAFRVIEAPTEQQFLRETTLRRVENTINQLTAKRQQILGNGEHESSVPINALSNQSNDLVASKPNKCFQSIPELFNAKPTGNSLAPFTCTWCNWKHKCWDNLVLKPKAKSKAKDPVLVWYTDYKEEVNE